MQRQKTRVLLASEYPQVRHFLSRVIEQEDGTDIVGEADDTRSALTLARDLRPDVAVIDCFLPHRKGSSNVTLSHISGLDTAQTITREISGSTVILLTNLDTAFPPSDSLISNPVLIHFMENAGTNLSFEIKDLQYEGVQAKNLIFANIKIADMTASPLEATKISDRVILFGIFGIVGGFFLFITLMLAPIGIALGLAGAATVVFGIVGKLSASWWRKIKGETEKD